MIKLPLSIARCEELLQPFNPITTVERGLYHFEYQTYPRVAFREALMNAFCHVDFRIAGPIMVKLYADRLEISNNGGFIGGITTENILHHQPAARNPLLVDALTRLRLVNRSNLGVSRMFSAMLMEGKEPPDIREIGESVTLTFMRRDLLPDFRLFVAEESRAGRDLNVDALLVLQYLLKHPELETTEAARLCQLSDARMRERLTAMERAGYVEHGGTGRGAYWTLRPEIHRKLAPNSRAEHNRRIDWDAAKTRVLSILMERAKRGGDGMNNREIRQVTHFDRNQVRRLMQELMIESPKLEKIGERRWTRYEYRIHNA